jgi:hypothetical protein
MPKKLTRRGVLAAAASTAVAGVLPIVVPSEPTSSESTWDWLMSVEKDAFNLKGVTSESNWWDEAETEGFARGWAAHNPTRKRNV